MKKDKWKCSICGAVYHIATKVHTTPCGLVFVCGTCESLRKDRWRALFPRWFEEHTRLPTVQEWRLLQKEYEESLKIQATPTLQPAQPVTIDDESELPLNYKKKGYARMPIPEAELVFFQRGKPEPEEPKPAESQLVEPAPEKPVTEPAKPVEPQPVVAESAGVRPFEPDFEEPEPYRFKLAAHPRPLTSIRDLSDEAIQADVARQLRGRIGLARVSASLALLDK